jgi:hypothetical protein
MFLILIQMLFMFTIFEFAIGFPLLSVHQANTELRILPNGGEPTVGTHPAKYQLIVQLPANVHQSEYLMAK